MGDLCPCVSLTCKSVNASIGYVEHWMCGESWLAIKDYSIFIWIIYTIVVQLIHVHLHVHNSILLLSPFLTLYTR